MVKKSLKPRSKSQIGKANRSAGARFELKVRADLETKGWVVSKWQNNLELTCKVCKSKMKSDTNKNKAYCKKCEDYTEFYIKKIVGAKPGRFRMMQTGFPDFIAFQNINRKAPVRKRLSDTAEVHLEVEYDTEEYKLIGVEAKTNGYLDRIEKVKCKWLLDNKIFSKILIAKKSKKRGEVEYKEFKNE